MRNYVNPVSIETIQSDSLVDHLLKKSPLNNLNLLLLYRYISLLFTSLFYIYGSQTSFVLKTGVVILLGVVAWVITDLQRRHFQQTNIVKMIVWTETLGVSLLLVSTGGIASPFIWYALNPVFIAALLLNPRTCWGTLLFYLSSVTIIAPYEGNIKGLLEENAYFYLVCLLITLLVSLFSRLTKELHEQQGELLQENQELTTTNEKYKDTLENIMSLYHMLEGFSANSSPKRLTEVMASALMKSMQRDSAFFWVMDYPTEQVYMCNETSRVNLEKDITTRWHQLLHEKEAFIYQYNSESFWMKVIRTSKYVGIIGVKVTNELEMKTHYLLNRTFEFLTDLSQMLLEKMHIEQIVTQQSLLDERNRIANELHDSVSQRLFGIVYSLHSLQVKSRNISISELEQEHAFLLQTANSTMKELRSSIFRLSSVKQGESSFLEHIGNYLSEYARLNEISILSDIRGEEEYLITSMKSGLYRIISEACGNAVRHGRCTAIEVTLAILEEKISLEIQDNGTGIRTPVEGSKEKGIGLSNMQHIVYSFGGSFKIESFQGLGTSIQIEMPTANTLTKQEVLR